MPGTDFVRDISRYSRPCRAQLGEVRVYRAAREGPESVTKLPHAVRKTCTRPTVPDRSVEPVSSTRRQPSSREIERPESTYTGHSSASCRSVQYPSPSEGASEDRPKLRQSPL